MMHIASGALCDELWPIMMVPFLKRFGHKIRLTDGELRRGFVVKLKEKPFGTSKNLDKRLSDRRH
jgi:hypothetical protein